MWNTNQNKNKKHKLTIHFFDCLLSYLSGDSIQTFPVDIDVPAGWTLEGDIVISARLEDHVTIFCYNRWSEIIWKTRKNLSSYVKKNM